MVLRLDLIRFCPRALHLIWWFISDVLLQKPMTKIVLRSDFVLLLEGIILKITDSYFYWRPSWAPCLVFLWFRALLIYILYDTVCWHNAHLFLTVPKVLAVVYSTCSSYPEENQEVVCRALERAKTCSEQEGEPKRANFSLRSASVSWCTLCICLCHCFSLSVCLAVCQPAGLFVYLPSDRFLSKSQHTSGIKNWTSLKI